MECTANAISDNSASSDWESQMSEKAESVVATARSVKSTASTSSQSILESYVDAMDRNEQVYLSLDIHTCFVVIYT